MKKTNIIALVAALSLTLGTTGAVTGCGRAVEGSEWQPIFPLEDTSLETAMKEYATSKLNDGKNIYIVCNSGKRGAEKTTGILIEAGIDKSKIFTVEGGAKALAEIDGALKPVQ